MLDSKESSSLSSEMWAVESELFIWPTAKQMDRKWLQVTCRAVVLNETVYQRTSSLNVTAPVAGTSSLAQQIQRTSRPSSSSSSSSSGQVSASMASSQHSGTSYSYPAANTGTWSNKSLHRLLLVYKTPFFLERKVESTRHSVYNVRYRSQYAGCC